MAKETSTPVAGARVRRRVGQIRRAENPELGRRGVQPPPTLTPELSADIHALKGLLGGRETVARKKRVLHALEASLGIVLTACKASNVPRASFYVWQRNDPTFAQAVSDIQEVQIDYVESKLLSNIQKNDVASTIFYLKTKGKNRGYSERFEHTGADGAPIAHADVGKLATEVGGDALQNAAKALLKYSNEPAT